jgi:hypothetical protein
VEHGGEYALRHVIADREVGIGAAKVLRIALHSMPERAIVVIEHAFARDDSGERKSPPIERILRGNVKLLLN